MTRDTRNLLVAVTTLLAVGAGALFSASGVYAEHSSRFGDAYFFLKRQLLWLVFAAVALILTASMRPEVWRRQRWLLLGVTVACLALVFVPGIGAEINGARRWLRLGPFYFQPSEMAKVTLAIFLAGFIAHNPGRLREFWGGFLPAILSVSVVTGLILLEPDLGTALFIAGMMTVVLLVAGARPVHFAPVLLVAGMAVVVLLMSHDYVRQRLEVWTNPQADPTGSGYQIRQSLIALGSGGLIGTGLGKGVQKLFYLPEGHTDFILSVLGEELGFLGVAGVLLLFASIGLTGWRICRRTHDPFSFYLAFALTSGVVIQAATNIAVVTAAIPTKGIPLPFLSYGGSSLMMTTVSIGILISIAEQPAESADPKRILVPDALVDPA